jgi:hypothetical protein
MEIMHVGVFIVEILLIAAFPLSAILIGWHTRSRVLSIAAGFFFFPLFMVACMLVTGSVPASGGWLEIAVKYYVALGVVGGLAGFFASQGTKRYLAVSEILALLWGLVFLTGIR